MRARTRSILFLASLLGLVPLSAVSCTADSPQPTGSTEQAAINPPLPGNLNLILNAKTTVTIGAVTQVFGDVASSGVNGSVLFDVSSSQSSFNVLANTVTVNVFASVGHVFGNDVTIHGSASQVSLGLDPRTLPPVPAVTPASPGTTNVSTNRDQSKQLCPGQYGAISLGMNSTLNLNGGVYQVTRLNLADGARLEPSEPVVILVSGGVTTGVGAFIGPSSQALNLMTAADIRIEAGGAITLGDNNQVRAHLLAAGKITTGNALSLSGAAWARTINIGPQSVILGEGVFAAQAPPVGPPCNDNNACTTDTCESNLGVVSCKNTPLPSGASCDDGNACTGAGRCNGASQCLPGTNLPDGTTCSDGTCQAGVCVSPRAEFSDDYVQFRSPTQAQCDRWNDYRINQLANGSYSRITMSGTPFDPTGVTCGDPMAATQICHALHQGMFASVPCDGHFWNVGACNGIVLNLDVGICDCDPGPGHAIRPCIANQNWGGMNTQTCGAPSQTMTVVCE